MTSADQDRSYTVGDLARRAGVSVRTLHHYEAIGLLVPSARTAAGHRRYTRSDLARLARIRGLAALGFALDQIKACLDDETWSPLRLVEDHLTRAREELTAQQDLCDRLEGLRDHLSRGTDDPEHFIETVELMNMIEKHYTPEQRETLARRRETVGEAEIHRIENEWSTLFADVRAELARNTPPGAPEAQALAARWRALQQETVAGFTGGDPAIEESLDRLYHENPVDQIHPTFDPAIFAYMKQALATSNAGDTEADQDEDEA